jgi:hypothetical protein
MHDPPTKPLYREEASIAIFKFNPGGGHLALAQNF